MYAIGHFALGYLTGKSSSKLLKTNVSMPLMLAVSVIPDIDLILEILNPTIFMHRGLTHSITVYTVLLIPFFIIYGKQAIPYYFVLLSHSLVGDFFTGGVGAFWPVSQDWFGCFLMQIGSLADVLVELALFAGATAIMFKAGDLKAILHPNIENLALIVAFGAVLGPILSIGEIEGNLPTLLLVPSLFWLVLFAYSIILALRGNLQSPQKEKPQISL
jgi:membrane-bound metal-dependent hydrolase YbcI (DUF457 family)